MAIRRQPILRLSLAEKPSLAIDESTTELLLSFLDPDHPSPIRAVARAFVRSERRRHVYALFKLPQPHAAMRLDTSSAKENLDTASTECPDADADAAGESSDFEDSAATPHIELPEEEEEESNEEEEEESSYTERCDACGKNVISMVYSPDESECNTSVQHVATVAMDTFLDLPLLPRRAQAYLWARRKSMELCICGGGEGHVTDSCFDHLMLLDVDGNDIEDEAEMWDIHAPQAAHRCV